ncbi:DUF1778 domain-containing protein [Floridanema aerugineum]|jgi:uncharacterized protein (DUF1778 family)|uniref:DUF1778 domain-containing protein n=1 Tax=Floridaenema aerugineum BLCC-F46 TaxID=3153654 RepID=A0ABV4XEL5_9CYAN
MSQQKQKDVRVTARVSAKVRETLQEAAELSGASLNQFVVQAALKEAHKVLEEQKTIELSNADADRIFELLENPPKASDKLKAAFEKHAIFFRENH